MKMVEGANNVGLRTAIIGYQSIIASLKAENARLVKERDNYRFSPQGDNHHNALKCPYCNPGMVDFEARATAAEAEREALREALAPFAEAQGHFDGHVRDDDPVPVALRNIRAHHIRRACALLPRQDDRLSGKGCGE